MQDDIVKRLVNNEKWPNIENSESLELLNEMADTIFSKGTFEGYLSATLIYHQIIESMVKHLIENCYFFIEVSVYPMGYKYKIDESRMTGNYIKELQLTLDFDKKEDFINKCLEFNKIRNYVVHELKKDIDNKIFETKLKMSKGIFDDIYSLYDEVQDWFRLCFKDIGKDVFTEEWIEFKENTNIHLT